MSRYLIIAIAAALLLASAAPASAQVRLPYRAYYAPAYAPAPYTYSYAPGAVSWNGYYANPGYVYSPYRTYYSYPSSGYAWGYPMTYAPAYRVSPRYAYYSW